MVVANYRIVGRPIKAITPLTRRPELSTGQRTRPRANWNQLAGARCYRVRSRKDCHSRRSVSQNDRKQASIQRQVAMPRESAAQRILSHQPLPTSLRQRHLKPSRLGISSHQQHESRSALNAALPSHAWTVLAGHPRSAGNDNRMGCPAALPTRSDGKRR